MLLRRIIELNGGQPPLTYKRFQTLISRLDPPEMPVEMLTDTLMGRCVTPISEDHGDKYGVPSLEELGEKSNTLTRKQPQRWPTAFLVVETPIRISMYLFIHALKPKPNNKQTKIHGLKLWS